MILFHYTCVHAAPKIEKSGRLLGHAHRMMPQLPPMVWLTDLDVGARRELGLPPIQDGCDRVAVRVQVEIEDPLRWPSWARRNVPKAQWTAVEANCPGSLVAHWWLVMRAVPIQSMQGWPLPEVKR